jgi:hypothetical protein
MNKLQRYSRSLAWTTALLLSTLVAGCGGGGGRSPILGTGGSPALAPTVTSVVPAPNATGVAINGTLITATFSEPVNPITGTASFTVTCAAPCVNPAGTVSLNAAKTTATFTLAPGTSLFPNTLYTGTVTGATSIATGLAMTAPFVWHFTTGGTPDTTRPRVAFTNPATTTPGPTPGVPTNTSIIAVFTEEMAPATITNTSFTVTCVSPCVSPTPTGIVSYTPGTRTATFAPQTALAPNTTYTATITTAATDLAGNALAGNQAPLPAASNYIWTFTTGAGSDAVPPTVTTVSPPDLATNVCPQTTISATFSKAMNPATITTATFTLQTSGPPLGAPLGGTVTYDAASQVATLTPTSALVSGTNYTATVTTGVKDLAGNALAANKVWTFTVASAACSLPPTNPLGSAAPFGNLGGTAGTTNNGLLTVVNGDLGTTATTTSAITGFHDLNGDIYTETPTDKGLVNGTIYTCTVSTLGPTAAAVNPAHCAIATQARLDAQTAYNKLSPALLPGGNMAFAQLGGLTLFPGVYKSPSGSFLLTGSNLTLDAQGDANAVWVFQAASSLTVGDAAVPRSVILINGAQAKNVYWQVGSTGIINPSGGGTMVGTIIASSGIAISTVGNVSIVTLNGRAIGLNASVTMTNTVINVPAP